MGLLYVLLIVTATALAGLVVWRGVDKRRDQRAWRTLSGMAGSATGVFEADMIRDLPIAARRYFTFTIQQGAPLYRAVEIEMTGSLGLGSKEKPQYRLMSARQLLAPFHGLVWSVKAGPISGSDGYLSGESWTRFWLHGMLPVVRAGSTADHQRSAFGRLIAEAAFWLPASLLPSDHVSWEHLDDYRARAIVRYQHLQQAVDLTISRDGQPTHVLIQRWSNENRERVFREQPFGGELSGFELFSGYRLPTRVEGGNHFGTDQYFPFYKAEIQKFQFASSDAES